MLPSKTAPIPAIVARCTCQPLLPPYMFLLLLLPQHTLAFVMSSSTYVCPVGGSPIFGRIINLRWRVRRGEKPPACLHRWCRLFRTPIRGKAAAATVRALQHAAHTSSGRCLELAYIVEHVRIVESTTRLILGPGRHIRGELGSRAWWRGEINELAARILTDSGSRMAYTGRAG